MPIRLSDIITKEFQDEIQDSFAYATGFGVVFTDPKGRHIGEGSNFSRFCVAVNRDKEGARRCYLSNKRATEIGLKTGKPCVYVCHAGMIDIAIPLTYEGSYVGAITAGQVLCPNMSDYPSDPISRDFGWLRPEEVAELFSEIKTLTRHQIEATTSALANISNYVIQKVAYAKAQENLNEKQQRIADYEQKQMQLEHQIKVAELEALQKQVTPHFIFNVINSVLRLIAMGEYDSAADMLTSFSGMMRYSLSNVSTSIKLEQELGYIRNYLDVQQHRFADRVTYSIDCEPDMLDLRIPFFSLQPLVENSLEHGLLTLARKGNVRLSCRSTPSEYLIHISDDGKGMNKAQLDGIRSGLASRLHAHETDHVGLRNCYNRLRLMYGDKVDFAVDSVLGEGTKITVTVRRR